MRIPRYQLFIALIASIVFIACSSPKKLYNNGKYKSVIRQLDSKAKKGSLNKEEISILEKSIAKMLEEEGVVLQNKISSDNLEDWQEGYKSLDALDKKQSTYTSFNQLDQSKLGLIDIGQWDDKFSNVLYTYHVEAYTDYYEKYLATENKNYIIDAFDELGQVAHFDRGEINTDSLRNEFAKLGVRSISLDFKDESFNMFELRHLRFYVRPSDSKWSDYGKVTNPDYIAIVTLQNLDKDDDRSENQRRYTNDVVVDVEVRTDAEGNQVEVPIVETIEAVVNEVTFTYAVQARVEVEIYWNKESKLLARESFREQIYTQEIEAYMLSGDDRALPPGININNGSPFSDSFRFDYDDLIEEALEIISEDVEDYIESF